MSGHYFKSLFALIFCVFLVSQKSQAQQQNLWGSGYYQGGISCPYQTSVARNATSMSDDEKDARRDIATLNRDLALSKSKVAKDTATSASLRRQIATYFDGSVVDFLLDTHIEGAKLCKDYRSVSNGCVAPPAPPAPPAPVAAAGVSATVTSPPTPPPFTPAAGCDTKESPPDLLAKRWTESDGGLGPYCVGSYPTNAGSVASSICSDVSLRAEGHHSFSTSACVKALADYRKNRIDLANAADDVEKKNEEILAKNRAIADARELARIDREYRLANETESDCPECDAYSRGSNSGPQLHRDWTSTATNILGGVLNFALGQKAESAGREQAAQLGVMADHSYGYPYYQAGLAGVINGLTGPGAYGCAGGYNGSGFPYGANGQFGQNGGPNGAYGPFGANGGAFGYPQNMYGSPWGGGAFNPGLNMNGGFNGPFGGTGNGQFPGNGNMSMCFTWPCNTGGNGANFGLNGGVGGQFGLNSPFGNQYGQGSPFGNQFGNPQFNGQFGNPQFSGQFGLNGQLSSQYQLQMMQMQQQAANAVLPAANASSDAISTTNATAPNSGCANSTANGSAKCAITNVVYAEQLWNPRWAESFWRI